VQHGKLNSKRAEGGEVRRIRLHEKPGAQVQAGQGRLACFNLGWNNIQGIPTSSLVEDLLPDEPYLPILSHPGLFQMMQSYLKSERQNINANEDMNNP
jgi:hypothetical protein